jgi:hypothetical protein
MARKTPKTPTEHVQALAYVDHLLEAGTIRQDVAALRGKLTRIDELRREIGALEDDVLRGVQRVHAAAARDWNASEITAAKDAAAKDRGRI